ncbi:MAG: peptidase U32 family protein [Acholeplasmataceae bacterium]
MDLIVTLFEEARAPALLEHADGIIIGNERFATRLTHSFKAEEIDRLIALANRKKKRVYLSANQLFDDTMIEEFVRFLDRIDADGLTGIVVADLGVIEALGNGYRSVYNPETLLTNAYDFNMLAQEAIRGAFVAKEITMDDIVRIGKTKAYELFMVGHGHLNMFYSKRQLLATYKDHYALDDDFHGRQDLRLRERMREQEEYPVFEDRAGTHVFRSRVFATYAHLEELASVVDTLVIDTIFKDDDYALRVLQLYRDPDEAKALLLQKDYGETWDEGFLFRKTIYRNEV